MSGGTPPRDRKPLDQADVTAMVEARYADRVGPVREVAWLGNGDDNDVWTVNARWAVRVPRWRDYANALRREARLLAEVARQGGLGLAVPEFAPIAEPVTERCPYPFVVYPLIHGASLDACRDRFEHDEATLTRIGRAVGSALRRLHALDGERLGDVTFPTEPDFVRWQEPLAANGPAVRDALPPEVWDVVEPYVAGRVDPPPAAPRRVLTHFDLSAEHLLVDEATGRPLAIIDWADAAVADPAWDLIAWILDFRPPLVRALLAAYGDTVDAALASRAQFGARLCAVYQLHRALERGDATAVEHHRHRLMTRVRERSYEWSDAPLH